MALNLFLFTDIEGSTRLWQEHGDAMAEALARHDAILAAAIENAGGRVVKHTGDGVFAAFDDGDASACALEIQRRLQKEDWGAVGELRVRVAVHAGDAEQRGNDYFGPAVNRAARLCEACWGGQIVLSRAAADAATVPAGATLADLGIHLFKDLGEPEQVFQLVHGDLALRDFPPLRSLSARPHNLPPQPTPFIGRADELAAIRAAMEDPVCRLLTLLGPGGAGKSRLAIQAAAELADSFTWGGYFVPLAPVAEPEHVVAAVAEALRFSFYGAKDPKAQLKNYLSDKDVLLVLDNFEHVIPAGALAAELLEAAPRIKLLVTSRERLRLRAERVFEVGGMPYPPSAAADSFGDYAAVQLFVDTARRAQPSMELAEADRPAVVEICRRLDGLPLALELAASWARALSPDEIAAELAGGLELLASSAADIPDRHRSLAAVFNYSFRLLDDDERQALARLSVFQGGFNRQAAARVAGAALPTLTALGDKSLVRRTAPGRYDLHQLIKQFAAAELAADAAAAAETAARHTRYYTELVDGLEKDLVGARQKATLDAITADIDDVRAAWRRAVDTLDVAALARAVEPLYLYMYGRSWLRESIDTFGKAIAALAPRAEAPDADRDVRIVYAKCLMRRAMPLVYTGQFAEAAPLAHKALAASVRLGETKEVVLALNGLGVIQVYAGNNARARRICEAALKFALAVGYRNGASLALNTLGSVAGNQGDFALAKECFERSLDQTLPDASPSRVALLSVNLSTIERNLGNYAAARKLAAASLAAAQEVGNRRIISSSLYNLGMVSVQMGDFAAARGFFEEAVKIKRELNDLLELPLALAELGGALTAVGEPRRAVGTCAEAVASAEAAGHPATVLYCRGRLAIARMADGDAEEARALMRACLSDAQANGDKVLVATTLVQAARLHITGGEPARAAAIVGALEAGPLSEPHRAEVARFRLEALAGVDAAAFERGAGRDWFASAVEFV